MGPDVMQMLTSGPPHTSPDRKDTPVMAKNEAAQLDPPAAAAAGTSLSVASISHDLASLDQFDEILRTGEYNVEIIDDPGEISRQIIDQLLAAGSDAELQAFGNAEGWREHLEVPMELKNFKWLRSTIEGDGLPVYVVVQATDLTTGEARTLTCGSANVLAQLSNMARRGTLVGGVWMLVQSEQPTKAGYRPLMLKQPPAAA